MEKVRCNNCDAVVDVVPEKTYSIDPVTREPVLKQRFDWTLRCYQCGSVDTVKTREPYRLPRSERVKKQ